MTSFGGTGNDDLVGHEGTDLLWGDDGDDFLKGNEGDDTLRGEAGNDILRGDEGEDWLVGGDGNDELYGDAGADELLGQNGNDILDGGTNNDLLYAGDGDDTLRGDAGSDHLYGHGGDDLLDAGSDQAADVLTGGKGLDEFVVVGSIGSGSVDAVTDRAGFETYDGFDGKLTALAELNGDVLTITGMPGDDKIQIFRRNGQSEFEVKSEHESLGTFSTAAISEIVINGGDGDDLIDNVTNSIVRMRVNGGAGEDIIYGGDGADILNGGSHGDKIWGGDGEDTLLGEAGNDELFGEDDDDILRGGDGDDRIWGGRDHDVLVGGDGDDRLYGQDGNDKLYGQGGVDFVFGQAGDDFLASGTDGRKDTLTGGHGFDTFFGSEGNTEIEDIEGSEESVTLSEQEPLRSSPVFEEQSAQVELVGDVLDGSSDSVTFNKLLQTLRDDILQIRFQNLVLLRLHDSTVVFKSTTLNGQTSYDFAGRFLADEPATSISIAVAAGLGVLDTQQSAIDIINGQKRIRPNNANPPGVYPNLASGEKPSLNTILNTYQVASEERRIPGGIVAQVIGLDTPVTDTEADMLETLGVHSGIAGLWEFQSIRDLAFEVSEIVFPQDSPNSAIPGQTVGDDGHRDAFRHAFWSALLTLRYGAEWTEAFTNAHEGGIGNPAAKEAMDLYNNSQGIGIAQSVAFIGGDYSFPTLQSQLAQAITAEITNGTLVVIGVPQEKLTVNQC